MKRLTVDGDGIQQIAQYDARGQYSRITDANKAVEPVLFDAQYTYDAADRMLTETATDSKGKLYYRVDYTWDGAGNMIGKPVSGSGVNR